MLKGVSPMVTEAVKTQPNVDSLMRSLMDARTKTIYCSHIIGLEREATACREAISALITKIDEGARE